MLKIRKRREAQQGARAVGRIAQIEASIRGLDDEDLLDLADIFNSTTDTPIARYASAEMTRRKISL